MDNERPSDRGIRLTQRNAAKESLTLEGQNDKTEDEKNMASSAEDRTGDDTYRKTTTSSEYPSASKSASSQGFHPSTRTVPDSFAPPAFNGTNTDADAWLEHFRRYAAYRQLSDADIVAIFPLFLKDAAIDWFDTLSPDLKNDFDPEETILRKRKD